LIKPSELTFWDDGKGEKLGGFSHGIDFAILSDFWAPVLALMQTIEFIPVCPYTIFTSKLFRWCVGLSATLPE
jgi:hypothetical protein